MHVSWGSRKCEGICIWCLEPIFKKCIISWDVVFSETEMTYRPKVLGYEPGGNHDGEKANIKVDFDR